MHLKGVNKLRNKKRVILKVGAAIIAFALIGVLLIFTNAFVGNPISAMIANRAIEKYVDKYYPYLDLEVEKVTYNFKTGSYMARAWSKTSIDTKFNIYYDRGHIRDDYESNVLGKYNTLYRLSDEYSVIARNIIAKKLGYENNTTIVIYNMDDEDKDILELDMEFDRSLPLDSEVLIRLDLEDISIEEAAKVLVDAHRAFVEDNCNFTEYSLFAEKDGTHISVHGVTPKDIEGGELVDLLKEARDKDGDSRIYVHIKEENK